MPLDPKQQPPYYTPGTTPSPLTGGIQRLNTNFSSIQTSGTTETDFYTYTLPANTLTQNGDILLIRFESVNTNAANDHIVRFYIDGTAQATYNQQANLFTLFEIQVMRMGATYAMITSQFFGNPEQGTPTQQFEPSLDWTQATPIKFTGQCSGTGIITTVLMTINKQTI